MAKKVIFERKNVLVAGGAGFIGSHLCDRLVKDYNVICVDNFITGTEDNIHHLLPNPNFEFIRHDIIEPLDLESLPEVKKFKIQFQGIQEIYNCACPTSPLRYNEIPIETILTNSHGTKNLLDLALKHQAKFLHLSTSAIYGEPTNTPVFPEDYWGYIDPIGPRSCYNEGKRFAESLIVNFRNKYKLEAKIIRLFNTYGPRLKLTDGRMLPDFIKSALDNEDLVIYGDKETTSSFCYIDDVIDGMIRMMNSKETGPINLGSPEEYKVADIARKIIDLTNSQSKITFTKPLPFTNRQGIPEVGLAREKLGWFPLVALDQGLKITCEEMRASKGVVKGW